LALTLLFIASAMNLYLDPNWQETEFANENVIFVLFKENKKLGRLFKLLAVFGR
jgi:hypothetical protein